jgi:hypothetical protein
MVAVSTAEGRTQKLHRNESLLVGRRPRKPAIVLSSGRSLALIMAIQSYWRNSAKSIGSIRCPLNHLPSGLLKPFRSAPLRKQSPRCFSTPGASTQDFLDLIFCRHAFGYRERRQAQMPSDAPLPQSVSTCAQSFALMLSSPWFLAAEHLAPTTVVSFCV